MSDEKTKREISAGFIVYRRTSEGLKFLLLYHGRNYWNFPKGKIELSPAKILPARTSAEAGRTGKTSAGRETSLRAALRETREETGLTGEDLRIIGNFRTNQRYFFRSQGQPIFKIVIFYLAETKNPRIKVSSEHQGYGWFLYPEAFKILRKYQGNQKILKQAYDFIKNRRLTRTIR